MKKWKLVLYSLAFCLYVKHYVRMTKKSVTIRFPWLFKELFSVVVWPQTLAYYLFLSFIDKKASIRSWVVQDKDKFEYPELDDIQKHNGEAKPVIYRPEMLKNVENGKMMTRSFTIRGATDRLNLVDEKKLSKLRKAILGALEMGDKNTKINLKEWKEEQLFQLFDSLPPIDVAELFPKRQENGEFAGIQLQGYTIMLQNASLLNYALPARGWGKVFFSKLEVEPVVFHLNHLFSYLRSMLFPSESECPQHDGFEVKLCFPLSTGARLLNVEFRNKTTTAMAYENMPVIDYFVNLNPKTADKKKGTEEEEKEKVRLLGTYFIRDKFGGFFALQEE